MSSLYLDTSVVLRATLESGLEPHLADQIASATVLVTSRLSLVESSRALLRIRHTREVSEEKLSKADAEIAALWGRTNIWELTREVCELGRQVAPTKALRTLDALHLATYLLAKQKVNSLELFTVDERLRQAAQ